MRKKQRVTCALDCPDTCGLLAEVAEGRLVKVSGDPDHPITKGFICNKMRAYPKRQHHPKRPLFPMRLRGKKGAQQFERVEWKEALDDIADRLTGIIDRYGAEAVLPYAYAGTHGVIEGTQPLAFFRAIGASELDKTICASAGAAGWQASYGSPSVGVDPEDVAHAQLILLWGANTVTTNLHLLPMLKQARKRGARIVHVDCYRNRTSRYADDLIRVKPGSDAALAYAMARVIIHLGLHDEAYLKKATLGFEAYRAEAETWTLDRAEAQTGVPAKTIEQLAISFAKATPAFIRVSYGMTRHPGGANSLRAVALLPALTGAWQYRGGGALCSTSGGFPLNKTYLGGRHLLEEPGAPKGYLRPNRNARHINMSRLATSLNQSDPSLKALFVFNSNPAVVAPDAGRVREGLLRDDLFTVVLENAFTPTAQMADYVLPATTFFEHPDLYVSYGHYYISFSEPLLQPPLETRPNTWVFKELAKRLGIDEPTIHFDTATMAEALLSTDHPYLEGITLDRLREKGFLRLNIGRPFMPFTEGAATPSKKIELDPPPEVIPTTPAPGCPLILLTPPAHHFLNTTFGCVDSLIKREGGEPRLQIHPKDATPRHIETGNLVHIRSEQGEITAHALVTDDPMPGTVVLEGIWWPEQAPDQKPANTLTSERLTDMGNGATFHATPVEVTL